MKVEVIEIPPAEPVKEYILTLTEEEAALIKALTGRISGYSNIRTLADKIYYGLERVNVGPMKGDERLTGDVRVIKDKE